MTQEELQGKISKMESGLASGAIPEGARASVEAALKTAKAELEKMSSAAPAEPTPANDPAPKAKPGPKAREKRAKKKAAPFTGKAVDRDGNEIQVGDMVEVVVKGNTFDAQVINLKRVEGGGHQVRFKDAAGKVKTPMLQPGAILLKAKGAGVLDIKKPMPADKVKKAETHDRVDCDDNQNILITPDGIVEIDVPNVADPSKGDRILAHPDGTPIAVIEGSEKGKHFKKTKEVKTTTDKKGQVKIDLEDAPEDAAKEKEADDKTKYTKVKAKKPTGKCEFTREQAKSPSLMTFLEGMRMMWHDGESKDKIVGVYYIRETHKVVLKIKVYDFLDLFGTMKFFAVCPESGKLTKHEKPVRGAYSVLLGEDAMKTFYRHPFSASCKRVSRALYVECYKNGACSTEKQQRLYQIFAQKCSRKENEYSREYMKYAHQKTAEKWDGYTGKKTYSQIFKEVLASLRKA